MTDNEIIKAYEEHIERTKNIKYGARKMAMVDVGLLKDTLDIINRQKAENEELNNTIECYKRECNKLSSLIPKARAEAKKEFAEELIYKIVNTPTKFESTYYMYRDGIAFRQNEIIDIIKEMVGEG